MKFQEKMHPGRDAIGQDAESVRQEERGRIAREIHDELGQILAFVRLEADRLDQEARRERSASAAAFRERSADLVNGIDAAIDAVRRISAGLRPRQLGKAALSPSKGLSQAAEALIGEFRSCTGIKCAWKGKESPNGLDETASLVVLRILQESLTNVARHAQARNVRIVMTRKDGWFQMRVADDGIGIRLQEPFEARSRGISGMAERACRVGGIVSVSPKRSGGTLVTFRMPARKGCPAPVKPKANENTRMKLHSDKGRTCTFIVR